MGMLQEILACGQEEMSGFSLGVTFILAGEMIFKISKLQCVSVQSIATSTIHHKYPLCNSMA